jgi:hypothetical protein
MSIHGRSELQDRLAARLFYLEKPSEVAHAAAALLAEQIGRGKFRYQPTNRVLVRRSAGRAECMRIESSYHNRAGRLIEVTVANLEVSDEALRTWRKQNPQLTVERDRSASGIVCATSFYDIAKQPRLVLTVPDTRAARTAAYAEYLEQVALPWFAATADPAQLAETAPDALLRPWGFAADLLEFLVSRDERDQARRLIDRVLELGPAQRAGFQQGRQAARHGQRVQWHTAPSLGWSSEMLGIEQSE